MRNERFQTAQEILSQRFGHDTLIALSTVERRASGDVIPCVRAVNAYYENGCFYVITHAKSGKMRQIEQNSAVAVCGDWFTAHGIGENMGHILTPAHAELAATLRKAFASWYDNGHVREDDPDTCILCIRLTNGVLMSHGVRYDVDFVNGEA